MSHNTYNQTWNISWRYLHLMLDSQTFTHNKIRINPITYPVLGSVWYAENLKGPDIDFDRADGITGIGLMGVAWSLVAIVTRSTFIVKAPFSGVRLAEAMRKLDISSLDELWQLLSKNCNKKSKCALNDTNKNLTQFHTNKGVVNFICKQN